MEAYAEKALGQHEVRLHEFRCHMVSIFVLKEKYLSFGLSLGKSENYGPHSYSLVHLRLQHRERRRELPGKRVALKNVGIMQRKNCTVKLLVKIARITQVYTSVHYTPSKWNKSNAFSMSGLRQCGLTNVVTYDWTSCYCMATVKPPMTSPQK
uniref:Uncharacterized protein n=1 Tax=Trichuris muris TaxID=70415 RepID=A0A5S6Q273_TRIMR